MKKLFLFLLTLMLLFPHVVSAQTFDNGKNIVLSKDTIVNENYFAAGSAVTVLGTVNGDTYVAGGTVTIDGTLNGDLFVAAGTVNVDGTVTGSVRSAGGQITVSGTVDGNITAFGGNVTLVKTAAIGKSVVIAGGQIHVMAPVTLGAVLVGGQVTVSEKIGGNLLAATGTLVLTPNASIDGNATYYSETKATMQPGATVSGMINFHKQTYTQDMKVRAEVAQNASRSAGIAFKVFSFLAACIVGWLLMYLAPKFMKKTTDYMDKQLMMSAGIGFITLILMPVLMVMLFITLLGMPIAFFLMFALVTLLYISHIFVGLYVGEKVFRMLKVKQSPYLALFVGLAVLALATSIPFIGGLVCLLATVIGVGAVIETKKAYFTLLKTKELI
ncbi:MAG: hypothetical protein WC775_03655 [Patescibacteria group bacterium]|jgi:cytoskeletal protein CcmA (bactofilin family)